MFVLQLYNIFTTSKSTMRISSVALVSLNQIPRFFSLDFS